MSPFSGPSRAHVATRGGGDTRTANKGRISSIETDDVVVPMIVMTTTATNGGGGSSEGSGGTAVTRASNAMIVETNVEMATKTGTTCGRMEVGRQ